ncbi:MAG: spore germination protein [Bacillota bacterium]
MKFWKRIWRSAARKTKNDPAGGSQPLSKSLAVNLARVRTILGENSDIDIREFSIGKRQQVAGFLVLVDGLVDKSIVNDNILQPLLTSARLVEPDGFPPGKRVFQQVKESILAVGHLEEVYTMDEVLDGILSGDTAIFLDGNEAAFIAGTRGWESRGVQESVVEMAVRGPREGFTETLRTNTSLLRRKIKNVNLRVENMLVGKQTRTTVCLLYIKGIAGNKVVEEVRRRLEHIETDAVLDSGVLVEFIEDAPFSPLPTVYLSERPDTVASKLLEGRVALLIEGSPTAMTVPTVFMEFMISSEDYYSRPIYATITRWLRAISLLATLFAPALYVAAVTFHQEMIPVELLLRMAGAREGVPFPAVLEVLIMGIIFEILREAGIRMPRPIGQAVSIVGALILGEAASRAGMVSNPVIIVAAFTGITLFAISSPELSFSLVAFRVFFVFLAATFGLFGIVTGALFTLVYMVSLRSFGVPYLSPLAPIILSDLKDTLIRAPWWAMLLRPHFTGGQNPARQRFLLRPRPPAKK